MKILIKDSERVIIINQYEILEKIDTENKDFYKKAIKILQNGYEKYYYRAMPSLNKANNNDVELVEDILFIYSMVEDYKVDNPQEAKIIDKLDYSHFFGFDGNYESQYVELSLFLINELNMYGNKKEYFNKNITGYMKMANFYKEMIKRWKKDLDKKTSLNLNEIKYILLDKGVRLFL